jgi:hypothetical protein
VLRILLERLAGIGPEATTNDGQQLFADYLRELLSTVARETLGRFDEKVGDL